MPVYRRTKKQALHILEEEEVYILLLPSPSQPPLVHISISNKNQIKILRRPERRDTTASHTMEEKVSRVFFPNRKELVFFFIGWGERIREYLLPVFYGGTTRKRRLPASQNCCCFTGVFLQVICCPRFFYAQRDEKEKVLKLAFREMTPPSPSL